MANVKARLQIIRGLKSEIPVLKLGEMGYATDTNELFIGDPTDGNVLVNASFYDDSPITNTVDKLKTDVAALTLAMENKVEVDPGKKLSSNDFTNTYKSKLDGLKNYDDTDLKSSVENKVDKVEGKGLSTNDYTDIDKSKVDSLPDDTSKILSAFNTSISHKMSREEGKSLMPDSEIERLSSVYNYDDTIISRDVEALKKYKVDKVEGRSLMFDDEIERLEKVFNYDDTQLRYDIEDLKDKKIDKVEGKTLIDEVELERLKSVDNYDDRPLLERILDVSSRVSYNTTDIVQLKKDIGTTSNIETLKENNNEATAKINELNAKISEIGDITETIDNVETAKKDYNGVIHDDLNSRINSDIDGVQQQINDSSYLPYEGTVLKADNSYHGLTKDTFIKGRTLQNLLLSKYIKTFYNASVQNNEFTLYHYDSENKNSIRIANGIVDMMKPNTKYTLIIETVFNNTGQPLQISNSMGILCGFKELVRRDLTDGSLGIVKLLVTTIDDLSTMNAILHFCFWDTSGDNTKYIKFKVSILEGDYTSTPINELPFVEGIYSVGDMSKNLFNKNEVDLTVFNEGKYIGSVDHATKPLNSLKPNTSYIFQVDRFANDGGVYLYADNVRTRKVSLNNPFTTSATENGYSFYFGQCGQSPFENLSIDDVSMQLEENNYRTSIEPYYEGIKVSIISNGKNLFNSNHIKYGNLISTTGLEAVSYSLLMSSKPIKIDRESKYIFNIVDENIAIHKICFYSGDVFITSVSPNRKSYVIDSGNADNIKFVLTYINGTTVDYNVDVMQYYKGNIQVEKVSSTETQPTEFEPYKESRIEYILDEPLRSLPNGVSDEIYLSGVLTRRISKVVFDGSENWIFEPNGNLQNHLTFATKNFLADASNNQTNRNASPICDRFLTISNGYNISSNCVYYTGTGNFLRINIDKNYLSTPDIAGFKAWLSTNPTTVYYELAVPVITQLEPKQLFSFEGATHISSENKLLPVISTKIPSNVQAVVSSLSLENESLNSNVKTLTDRNTLLEETNKEQDEVIDVTLCATDSMITMIEPLLDLVPMPMSLDEGIDPVNTNIVNMYVTMIIRKLKRLDQVPERYRNEVNRILQSM